MNEVIHADIFFFITSAAIILITILLVVMLFYGIRIFRNVSEISDTVRKESEEIAADMKVLREDIKVKGASLWSMWSIGKFFNKQFNKRKKRNEKQ